MTENNTRIITLCLVMLFLALPEKVIEADQKKQLDGLSARVSQWQKILLQTEKQKSQWKSEKDQLQTQLELMRAEKKMLSMKLKKNKQEKIKTEHDKESSLKKQAILNQTKKTILKSIHQSFEIFQKLLRQCPEFIQKKNEIAVYRLQENLSREGETDLLSAKESLNSLLLELHKDQQAYHIRNDLILCPDGKKREMKVFYLGLACAYALSSRSQEYAIYASANTGWTWSRVHDVKSVKKLIHVYQNKDIAQLVDLPLQVRGEQ